MPFSEIVGHERPLETLRRGLERNRLHHAYLFLGPEGVGKRAVAVALAMAIHCSERGRDSCGQCGGCLSIRNGNHPDVRLIQPLPKKKDISIQQIRELERELSFRSLSGRKKVAIIDPADLMNHHAQNSLLKTLEEPPGDSLLVLLAKSMGGLLPTLVSRCLRLSFGLPPLGPAAEVVGRRRGIPADQARLLVSLSMGSLGAALSCEIDELLEERRKWIEQLCALSPEDHRGIFALAEQMARDKERALKFLRWVEGWYRDILVYQIAGPTEEIRNADMVETIKEQASLCGVRHSLAVLSRIAWLARAMQRNYNRRLVLESFLMKVSVRV